MRLKGKVAVITGAGSGIGAATATMFSEEGAALVLSDINLESVAKVGDGLNNTTVVKTDVTNLSEVQSLIDITINTHGKIDILVNNAGIGPKLMSKTHQHTLEDWENVIAVNQTGVFYCMKLALDKMQNQERGNIINIASLAGLKASPNTLSYSASKFAVVGMTKSAALEYASKNIRINAVCPGYTKSALLDQLLGMRPDMGDILRNHIPMNRFGEAEEIAEAITWLASDETKFITGQTIILDGGISL